jgi:hypothetical protein
MALGTDKPRNCAAAGGGSVLPSAGAPSAGALFVSRETAAAMLGCSVGGLALAMDRGELEGLYLRVGRSVRFGAAAIKMRALGVTDTGAFVKALGVASLDDLVKWLDEERAP